MAKRKDPGPAIVDATYQGPPGDPRKWTRSYCPACNGEMLNTLPIGLTAQCKLWIAFGEEHKNCKMPEAAKPPNNSAVLPGKPGNDGV